MLLMIDAGPPTSRLYHFVNFLFLSRMMYLTFPMSLLVSRFFEQDICYLRSRDLIIVSSTFLSPCHFLRCILFLHSSLNVPSLLILSMFQAALRRLEVQIVEGDMLEIQSYPGF
jgi:hypothetical protein